MAKPNNNIHTPECRLSYPRLFEPEAGPNGGDAKYSTAMVFEPGADLKELKAAALVAAKEKFGDKAPALIKAGKLRMPFNDGAEKGHAEGSTVINARSKKRPGVVSTVPDPKNGGKASRITDEGEIYPGVVARVSLRPYGYDTAGNKGVTFNLVNVQKIRDGERLDSHVNAEDEFSADPTAVASLSDVTGEDDDGLDLDDLM